jgi:hypothetical protein
MRFPGGVFPCYTGARNGMTTSEKYALVNPRLLLPRKPRLKYKTIRLFYIFKAVCHIENGAFAFSVVFV